MKSFDIFLNVKVNISNVFGMLKLPAEADNAVRKKTHFFIFMPLLSTNFDATDADF